MQIICIGPQTFELCKGSEGNMSSLRTFLRNLILKSFSIVFINHGGRLSNNFCIYGGFDIIADGSTSVTLRWRVQCNMHTFVTEAGDAHVTLAKGGVYRREIKNKHTGEITGQVKFEPRLKRDKQSLSLGQYDTRVEAKIVYDIALNYYGDHEYGFLDFEDGGYLVGDSYSKGDRYFVIPPLCEKLEGKAKSTLVSSEAKKVYRHFKKKQAEYRKHRDLRLAASGAEFTGMPAYLGSGLGHEEVIRRDDGVNAEENLSGLSAARSLDFPSTPLEQPSYYDQYVGNLAVEGRVLNNDPGMITSSVPFHLGHTFAEPTPFDASNPLPLSACYEVLAQSSMDDVAALSGEDSRRKFEVQGTDILSYEPALTVAPVSLPNNSPASGFIGNVEVEALLQQDFGNTSQQEKQFVHQQFVNTLQQEKLQSVQEQLIKNLQQDKQELKEEKLELKRKVCELQTQLSELQLGFREHLLSCCSGENQPSKKRRAVYEIGELGEV
ncbi:hypothetical protein KC19_5G141600 [Ceratodon purpureus]|uniref:Uncharacterized protein n=1 Tax=Ceratodon purpureus TaxID=3225 RepID=A0A8T0I2J9_CERPU|nr:hypothetical protein KC19_5G141600 [Ceratodon purpureus]KAG0577246.1 hypothetical protein KC19_5G141600 [Ceratodon purpureus]KAG0577247.1 hypothetical protein KC19_5G141600 [Ceratodon purpureus]